MATASGVVEKVIVKEGSGSRGPWTKISYSVGGSWYGGFKNKDNAHFVAAVKEGDVVTVTYEQVGDFKNFTNVAVDKTAFNDDLSKVAAFKQESPAPYNVNDKEYRITWLASRKDAIEFVRLALEKDLIKLGEKATKKLDILEEHIKHFTDKFAVIAWDAKYKKHDKPQDDSKEEKATYVE